MNDIALRQQVWNAAFRVLDPLLVDAHDRATLIADEFAALSRSRRSRPIVSEETRAAIRADLMKAVYSYDQIRRRHGVGTSTVQRIAREITERGGTVHTAGKRKRGRNFRNAREDMV